MNDPKFEQLDAASTIARIPKNLSAVKEKIVESCRKAGRDPSEVTLIAVTKTRSVEEIKVLYNLGVRDFGESRFQEAKPKLDALPKDIRWHFIGTLQSNKAKQIAERFDVIHSVSKSSQIDEISKISRVVDVMIEVNIADEIQKAGISVNLLDELILLVVKCKQVRFRGLMTIGPKVSDREVSRKYFREMKRLSDSLGTQWFSMGMSEDFDVAITEGSTHVRVGSALFR